MPTPEENMQSVRSVAEEVIGSKNLKCADDWLSDDFVVIIYRAGQPKHDPGTAHPSSSGMNLAAEGRVARPGSAAVAARESPAGGG